MNQLLFVEDFCQKFYVKLLVLNGDVPLIRPSTLKKLLNLHDSKNADVSLITTKKTNPYGYGRVFLKGDFIERELLKRKIAMN